MAPQNSQQPPSSGMVTAVVAFYLVAALSMVMANKWVLSATETPLFFLMCQMVVAVVLFAVSDAFRLFPDRLTFNVKTCKGLVPMVGLNVLGLSFSNYTLKYVDASFYQVARGLVLPFTVVASFVFLHTRPSLKIFAACSIVTLGFFVGVFLDGAKVSVVGISFGIASSALTATHSIIIKQSLPVVNDSALLLSWYTNLLSTFVLLPIIVLAGEVPDVLKLFFGVDELLKESGSMSSLRTFVLGTALTGSLGFLMSIAALLSIQVTSPITHMISSAVRGVAATFLAMWLFKEVVSFGRATSIAVILFGSLYYTWVKHQEGVAAKARRYQRVELEDVEAGSANKGHARAS